jgi:hypothetical protein
MPNTIDLYQRETNQYNDSYSHLDEWQQIGTAKILAYRLIRDDGSDGHAHATRVIAPAALRAIDLTRAIEDTMRESNCRHEHDCCGCPSTHAHARRVSAREYAVTLFTFYNL